MDLKERCCKGLERSPYVRDEVINHQNMLSRKFFITSLRNTLCRAFSASVMIVLDTASNFVTGVPDTIGMFVTFVRDTFHAFITFVSDTIGAFVTFVPSTISRFVTFVSITVVIS
jgi:phage-related protein